MKPGIKGPVAEEPGSAAHAKLKKVLHKMIKEKPTSVPPQRGMKQVKQKQNDVLAPRTKRTTKSKIHASSFSSDSAGERLGEKMIIFDPIVKHPQQQKKVAQPKKNSLLRQMVLSED